MTRRLSNQRRKHNGVTYELLVGHTVIWRGRNPATAVDRLVKRHPKARIILRCPQPQGLLVAGETV